MIQIKDLGFSYGEKAVLKNINMNLEEGRLIFTNQLILKS